MEGTTPNFEETTKNLTGPTNWLEDPQSKEWTNRQVALTITFGVIIVVTVVSNSFVLCIFALAKRRLRNPTNMLLANLAFADLLVGLVVMPLLASLTILDKWIFGDLMCQAFDYIHFPLCGASMWSMIGIGVDRLIGVTRPLQYRNIMTRSKTIVLIGVIWVTALGMTSGPLTYWPKPKSKISTICSINLEKPLLIFLIFFVYWIPISATVVIYSFVYKFAVTPMKNYLNQQKCEESATKRSEHSRLARSIAFVTGAIFLFYAPVFVVFTIKAFQLPYYSVDILLIGIWIRYCCSTVNPFMYALAVPGFKQEIKERVFGFRRERGKMEESLTQSYVTGSEEQDKEYEDDLKIVRTKQNTRQTRIDRFCTQCGFLIRGQTTYKNARCDKCQREVLCSSWILPMSGNPSYFMCPSCPTIRFFDGVASCFCQNCNHKFEPMESQQSHEKQLTTVGRKPCQQMNCNRKNHVVTEVFQTPEMVSIMVSQGDPARQDVDTGQRANDVMEKLRSSVIVPYIQKRRTEMYNQGFRQVGGSDNVNSISLQELDEIVLHLERTYGINVNDK